MNISRFLVDKHFYTLSSFCNKTELIKSRYNLYQHIKSGQPTHETRLHYLPEKEFLTPGIKSIEYYSRRLKLSKQMPKNSVAIFSSNNVQFSSGSVFYPFQQNTNFFYLTGFLEPNSIGVLEKLKNNNDIDDFKFHLYVTEQNEYENLWYGERLGIEGAYNIFNADVSDDVKNAPKRIKELIKNKNCIFYDYNSENNTLIKNIIDESNVNIKSLNSLIINLRSIKSNSEIKVIQKCADISSKVINKAMSLVSNEYFYKEKTLEKFLEYEFVKHGCDGIAYVPVVASGLNGLTIHYTRNDDLLFRDELVLVDAGGKLGEFRSDISRVWPNSSAGFTEPQKDLYQAVLNTNIKCIDLCNEANNISLNDIHEFSLEILVQEMKNLSNFSNLTKADLSNFLYPHFIGHHLGLDLHDVPKKSVFDKLVKGNIITIEPGLYIPKNDKWPKCFQGIAIRIEDNICVGESKNKTLNLTKNCVKTLHDIERLINEKKNYLDTREENEILVI